MSPGNIRILIAFEHTGSLAREFHNLGFDVTSCDFKPQHCKWNHVQCDAFGLMSPAFDFMFAFPPCTYLAKAQIHLLHKSLSRYDKYLQAVEDVKMIFRSGVPRIAVENPAGALTKAFRPPDQIIRPWFFGDPYRKEICLWLKNCLPVISTLYNPIRKSVSNHTNSRMSQAQKSEIKSSWKFYPGMCKAIANQYGSFLLKDLQKN